MKWWCGRWRAVFPDPEGGYSKPLETMKDKELLQQLTEMALAGPADGASPAALLRRMSHFHGSEEGSSPRNRWRSSCCAVGSAGDGGGGSALGGLVAAAQCAAALGGGGEAGGEAAIAAADVTSCAQVNALRKGHASHKSYTSQATQAARC